MTMKKICTQLFALWLAGIFILQRAFKYGLELFPRHSTKPHYIIQICSVPLKISLTEYLQKNLPGEHFIYRVHLRTTLLYDLK